MPSLPRVIIIDGRGASTTTQVTPTTGTRRAATMLPLLLFIAAPIAPELLPCLYSSNILFADAAKYLMPVGAMHQTAFYAK